MGVFEAGGLLNSLLTLQAYCLALVFLSVRTEPGGAKAADQS